jgi:hypothetical protein
MTFDVVMKDLHAIYQAGPDGHIPAGLRLTENDIRRWTDLLGESRAVLYDRIATYLARGFNNLELPFGFCDAVVNGIFAVSISAYEGQPKLFWEVYLAFDEGEYYHDDKRDEDPVELYTRPEISRIVTSLNHAKS